MTYLEIKEACVQANRRYLDLLARFNHIKANSDNYSATALLEVQKAVKQSRLVYNNAREDVNRALKDMVKKP